MKTCSKCQENKPVSEFYQKPNRDRHKGDGLRTRCKPCVRSETSRVSRGRAESDPLYHRLVRGRHRARGLGRQADVFYGPELFEFWSKNGLPLDRCHDCSTSLRWDEGVKGNANQAHLDHVIPLSAGGDHTIENLAARCSRCNLAKHGRDMREAIPA